MNEFSGYTVPVLGGHWGMIRFARDAKPKPVLGEGGAPIVFSTELEALRAVNKHLVGYMNGLEYRRDGETLKPQSAGDALFPNLSVRTEESQPLIKRDKSHERLSRS